MELALATRRDATSHELFVADTGNNRIVVLDTTSGSLGGAIYPNYDGSVQRKVLGAQLSTLVDGATSGLLRPSGLALRDGYVFVTDNETGEVSGFDKQTGARVDWLDTQLPAGSLTGMTFDAAGRMYLIDTAGRQIIRVSAP